MPDAVLAALRIRARAIAERSHAPYSGRPEGAVLLLADGAWVPGVRIENASFPLTIPAFLAAYVAARVAGRAGDVRAAVATHPLREGEAEALVAALAPEAVLHRVAPDALVADEPLPDPANPLDPFLALPAPTSDAEGVRLAERIAGRAHAPHSGFPVGAVLEVEDGRHVPGANVEHDDWTRGLCAERVALATARSYGLRKARRLYVACPRAPEASPCGACRQVLAELAPGLPVVMGRGDGPPEATTPEALLPGAFHADFLRA